MTIHDRAVAARRLVRLLQAAVHDDDAINDTELEEAINEHLSALWTHLDAIVHAPGAENITAGAR